MSDKLEMPIDQFAEAVVKENARLNNRIEKLEAALRPFALWADAYEPDEGDEHELAWNHQATIGMLRVARQALNDRPVYKEGYRAVEEAMGHPSPEFWVERK
jgi:hypothetical protein